MVKQLLCKAIHTFVLDYFQFEFVVQKTLDLVNKRPVAFKESLRSLDIDDVPFCITPQMLVRGYETFSLNIIPYIQGDNSDSSDPSFTPMESSAEIVRGYEKLARVRARLLDVYHSEFLTTLVSQAVDKKDRYLPVQHKPIKPGDIVLLVDKHLKRYHYPMARVCEVETNSLGEVTAAYLFKGATREKVYRHVTSLILLLSTDFDETIGGKSTVTLQTVRGQSTEATPPVRIQPARAATQACRSSLKRLLSDE